MKIRDLKFILSLFAMSFCSCGESNSDLDNIYPSKDIVIATHSEWAKQHYPERILEFKTNPLQTNDIVFLGNSITEQGGAWHEKVSNIKAKNRGISGDTTDGVLARLGELIYYKPSQVFILIGINDLFRNDMESKKVHGNIMQIVQRINSESKETEIYIQTILPTTTKEINAKINETNVLLEKSQNHNAYTLINLYDEFVTDNGLMNMDLSSDGVHLNEKGYQVWAQKIKSLVGSK